MKILRLLANAILTMVREAPLDTPLAWSFVTCVTKLVTKIGTRGQALDGVVGGARRPGGKAIPETCSA